MTVTKKAITKEEPESAGSQSSSQPPVSKDASAPAPRREHDTDVAHQLLNAVGVPAHDSVAWRLRWVCQRWLDSAGHSAGCQCRQCIGSRKLTLWYNAILLRAERELATIDDEEAQEVDDDTGD